MTKIDIWAKGFFQRHSSSVVSACLELWCNPYPYRGYSVPVLRVTVGDQDNYAFLKALLHSLGFQRQNNLGTNRLGQ